MFTVLLVIAKGVSATPIASLSCVVMSAKGLKLAMPAMLRTSPKPICPCERLIATCAAFAKGANGGMNAITLNRGAMSARKPGSSGLREGISLM